MGRIPPLMIYRKIIYQLASKIYKSKRIYALKLKHASNNSKSVLSYNGYRILK